ncbi:MAG: cyclic-di-AMP receptor [Firmicutes bacterium]|nr:cyclic-di-AMP receptor [Bacillota bacterium]
MKLIIAIIQNADRRALSAALRRAHIQHTRLNTTGGFLHEGNTTVLIGVEPEQVETTLELIQKHCHERTVIYRPGAGAMHPDAYVSPVHVTLGGATVFVVEATPHKIGGS